MNLHSDIKLFSDVLSASSKYFGIKSEFIEKDYWITLLLKNLVSSKYSEFAVFKGGTSLAKAYRLIDRFSEDLDIAIITSSCNNTYEIKKLIRNIEKHITINFNEIYIEGLTSKVSRYRRAVFEYLTIDNTNQNNKVILEINSFANPIPFNKVFIQTMIADFFVQTGNSIFINQFNLQSFEIKTLSIVQTLLEKLASLIRFSYDSQTFDSISSKIRHFYDLYFLMKQPCCIDFANTSQFKPRLEAILGHDKAMFDKPDGWQTKSISDSPLINDFSTIWKQIKTRYKNELSVLAFRPIPSEQEISASFIQLIKLLN